MNHLPKQGEGVEQISLRSAIPVEIEVIRSEENRNSKRNGYDDQHLLHRTQAVVSRREQAILGKSLCPG